MDQNQEKLKEEDVNDKLKDFQLDQIIKKKPPVKLENNQDESDHEIYQDLDNFKNFEIFQNRKTSSKNLSIKPANRKKQKPKKFIYGKEVFKNIENISEFLFFEYRNKGNHAKKLLSNQKFINWLKDNVNDNEAFNDWVNNVLK